MGKVQKKLRGFTQVKSGIASRPKAYLTGFTLVEMIVVVVIIGLLASLVTLNLLDNETKARDSRRVGDVAQIWKAVELYKANAFEALPSNGEENPKFVYIENSCSKSVEVEGGYDWEACSGGFSTAISKYLNPLPQDPVNDSATGNYYGYAYNSETPWHTVLAKMEIDTNANLTSTKCYGFIKDDSNAITGQITAADDPDQFALCR